MQGWERSLPKSEDTILGDKLGIRSALADAGIGFIVFSTNSFQYNLLQNDAGHRGPQVYNGQRFTRTLDSVTLFSTYDLGRIGLKDGQFIVSAFYSTNSLNSVDGPSSTRIGRLAYYQKLFDKAIEFKIGYFDNAYEFLGTQTGGSFAGGTLGPQASVPNEVGLSYSGLGTPAADLRINLKNHSYAKFGVQRSLPPGGATPEVAANPNGLRFVVPQTGVLAIGEGGWDRPASNGINATWIRVGGIFNTTNFDRLAGGQAHNNWAAYAAVDRQIVQTDPSSPNHGYYMGVTVNYAPPKENFVTKYLENRVYGVGIIKGRPFDLVSLVTTADFYSDSGLKTRTAQGQKSFAATYALVASYAYRLTPGLYLQPGLGAVVHPVYSPRYDTAFNGYLLLSIFL
jgi:porin